MTMTVPPSTFDELYALTQGGIAPDGKWNSRKWKEPTVISEF